MLNSIPARRPSEIDLALAESETLESRMAALQKDSEPPVAEMSAVRADYRAWHARTRRLLSGEALRKFDEHRDGGLISFGVAQFLAEPRKASPLEADDGSFPFGRWQYPFENVRQRLEKQRALLLDAAPVESSAETTAADLANVLRRLPEFLRVLQLRRPNWPVGGAISDERDLQVVVEALLRTLFDDVRPEDYVPSLGGANSRVDFVLPEVGIVVETKMTRQTLTARRLGEELLIDAGRYPAHPNCDAVVAFVYDPERRLGNPRGIERDLTLKTAAGHAFICVIAS